MDSFQAVYTILWIWTLAYIIPSLIGLQRTRRLNPVRYRRPDILMIIGVVVALDMSCECFLHILPQNGSWIGITESIVRLLLEDILQSCFVIIIFSSFSIFSINKRRIGIGEIGDAAQLNETEKEQAVAQLVKWINWCKFLLTMRFASIVIAANLIVVSIAIVIAIAATNESLLVDAVSCRFFEVPICYTLALIHTVKCTLCLVACMIMSYRMDVVVDEFGLKRNIRRVLRYSVAMFVSLAVIQASVAKSDFRQWDPAALALIALFSPINFYILVAHPVVEALRKQKEPSRYRLDYLDDYQDFEGFLKTKAGFASFRAHLEKEFCVENLLFWKATMEFKQLKDKKNIADKEKEIYNMFLAKNAPMEIQLSDDLKQRYREMTYGQDGSIRHMKIEVVNEKMQTTVKLKSLKTDVFVAATKEVLINLRHGPFSRYLAAANNSRLWTEYRHSRQVHGMYANIIGGRVIPEHKELTNTATGMTETTTNQI